MREFRFLLALIIGGAVAWYAGAEMDWSRFATKINQMRDRVRELQVREETNASQPGMSDAKLAMQQPKWPQSLRIKAQQQGVPFEEMGRRLSDQYNAAKRMNFAAVVERRLKDGNLLVRVDQSSRLLNSSADAPKGVYSLFGLPGAEEVQEGALFEFSGFVLGTYDYADVNGARRSVDEVMYEDPAASSSFGKSPRKTNGEWMWRKTKLDRP